MSLHISESVIWNETAGGVSLYHTDSGEFRTLNETGAQIWVLLALDGDRESVINRLSLVFGGSSTTIRNRIRTDVVAFIDDMIRDGLLAESVAA